MKKYSIGEVAKLCFVTAHTIRYYEKEGLIKIERKDNGLRVLSDNDIELLNIISCLKSTGMSISDIKDYFNLCNKKSMGKENFQLRRELFCKQREKLTEQIELLNKHLATVEYKIWYYENIEKFGDESDPLNCVKMREHYEKESGKK